MDDNDIKRWEQAHEDLKKMVFLKDDHIVINVHSEYNIALPRCNTAASILHWVRHLTEKTWMTNDVLRRFIDLACKENNVELENK